MIIFLIRLLFFIIMCDLQFNTYQAHWFYNLSIVWIFNNSVYILFYKVNLNKMFKII